MAKKSSQTKPPPEPVNAALEGGDVIETEETAPAAPEPDTVMVYDASSGQMKPMKRV